MLINTLSQVVQRCLVRMHAGTCPLKPKANSLLNLRASTSSADKKTVQSYGEGA